VNLLFFYAPKNVDDELHTQTLKTYVELTECSQNRKGMNEWMLELSDLGMWFLWPLLFLYRC